MLAQLKALQTRLENDSETPLTAEEIAFLEGINTSGDLRRNGPCQALAYDAALALGLSEIEAQIVTGEVDPQAMTKIKLYYNDGEYLTGYTVHGDEARLLENIGLAKYVDGWGYYVKDDVVEALGTEFLYHQALEFARPAQESKKFTEDSKKARIARIFAEAASTGKPVILYEYTAYCDLEDCSMDNVTVYAIPNGETRTVRSHTF